MLNAVGFSCDCRFRYLLLPLPVSLLHLPDEEFHLFSLNKCNQLHGAIRPTPQPCDDLVDRFLFGNPSFKPQLQPLLVAERIVHRDLVLQPYSNTNPYLSETSMLEVVLGPCLEAILQAKPPNIPLVSVGSGKSF